MERDNPAGALSTAPIATPDLTVRWWHCRLASKSMFQITDWQHPPGHLRFVKTMRIWHARLREPSLSLLLMIQLLILFAMPSARAAGVPLPHIVIDGVLFIPVVLTLVLARSRGAILTVILSVALTIAALAWRHERPDQIADAVSAAGQVLPQLALLWVVSTAVFGRDRTTHHRILGAIVMYLGIGMIFVSLDILLAQFEPDAFTHLPTNHFDVRQALTYFSFSTLTTSSSGDILPTHPISPISKQSAASCFRQFCWHGLSDCIARCGQIAEAPPACDQLTPAHRRMTAFSPVSNNPLSRDGRDANSARRLGVSTPRLARWAVL